MNNWPNLIGITGRAGVGKDTLADLFVERGYIKRALAKPMKDGLEAMLALPPGALYDRSMKEEAEYGREGKSPRVLAQTIGTEWGRKLIGENLWINLLIEEWIGMGRPHMVVPDVRFENEAAIIREHGGIIIHLRREGIDDVNPHVSEVGVRAHNSDLLFHNNSTPQALWDDMATILGDFEWLSEAHAWVVTNLDTDWDSYLEFVDSMWLNKTVSKERDRAHAITGFTEEAGEVAGLYKRHFRGDGEIDKGTLSKELGDAIYYWTKLCLIEGLDPRAVIADNIAKITDRKNRGVLKGTGSDR